MSEFETALSREEWGRLRYHGSDDAPDGGVSLMDWWDAELSDEALCPVVYHEGGWRYPIRRPHAAAALCLHGQPFGFTWEDVDAIDETLDTAPVDYMGQTSAHHFALHDLRDRIAALLPPRTPTDSPTNPAGSEEA